jgi:hypothetical protein
MRSTFLLGGWLLTVALAGLGGYTLATSPGSCPVPTDPGVLEQLEQQRALLVSLRAQVSALDLRLAEHARSPAPALAPASASTPAASAQAAAEPQPSEEEVEREERARAEAEALVARGERMVDTALGTGRWRSEDVHALRALLPQMPKAQREALLSRLITALNEGRLTPEERGLLF